MSTKEPTVARENLVNALNAEGEAKRSSLSKVNDYLERTLGDGYGLRHYAKYGDISSANLKKDGTLEVYAVGKAYGDRKGESGEVKIMSDSEYRNNAPRFFTNLRGEDDVSDVGIAYAANSVVRDIEKMGRKVKKIKYDYQWD